MSDLITEIEQSLAAFTDRLSQGVDSISKQPPSSSQLEKNRLKDSIVLDLNTTHIRR